jgi:YcxB-like protein
VDAIYPLLMFKSQARTLEMDQDGISTVIGKLSVRRSWNDIQSVSEQDTGIIIAGRNGNAFIVPRRAFVSDEEHRHFLSYAQNAVAAVNIASQASPWPVRIQMAAPGPWHQLAGHRRKPAGGEANKFDVHYTFNRVQ